MMESINILQLQEQESDSVFHNSYHHHPEKMKNSPSSRPSLMAYSSLVNNVKKNDVEEVAIEG